MINEQTFEELILEILFLQLNSSIATMSSFSMGVWFEAISFLDTQPSILLYVRPGKNELLINVFYVFM